jgi:hypothetical protein
MRSGMPSTSGPLSLDALTIPARRDGQLTRSLPRTSLTKPEREACHALFGMLEPQRTTTALSPTNVSCLA